MTEQKHIKNSDALLIFLDKEKPLPIDSKLKICRPQLLQILTARFIILDTLKFHYSNKEGKIVFESVVE